jgi:hypothetical protein
LTEWKNITTTNSGAFARELYEKYKPQDPVDFLLIAQLVMIRIAEPDRKSHPVGWPLWNDYVRRLEEFLSAAPAQRTTQALDDLEEFASWLSIKQKVKWTEDHDDVAGDTLVKQGRSYSQAKIAIRRVKQRFAGRPHTTAKMAVRGLELYLSKSGSRWPEVALQVCDAEHAKHDDSCTKRLETAVSQLRQFMKKHGIAIAQDTQ